MKSSSFQWFSMAGRNWIIIKKVFSLALIINALLTLACIAQIMFNYSSAFPNWSHIHPTLLTEAFYFGSSFGGVCEYLSQCENGSTFGYWAILVSSLRLWLYRLGGFRNFCGRIHIHFLAYHFICLHFKHNS